MTPRAAAATVALLLGALGLGGCGDVPRPFAHDPDRPRAGLSRLTSGTGVAVLAAGPAAEDMALALRALDVPAGTAEAPREGGYTLVPVADARGWDLIGPGGRLLLVVPAGGDLAAAAHSIAQAVEDDALRPVTLRAVAGEEAPGQPAGGPLPALRVGPIAGLEPARARVLAGAVEEALRRGGLTVSADAPWSVAGSFETAPAPPGQPVPVRLVWTLLDAQGAEHGAAQQVNAVPPDMLERGFAPLAAAIASGAAEGVVALAFEAARK
ncbi:hypothetical protein ACM64Y_17525 [Novispirillum sp. DQ9]|uniref:hypothetical protein n=1 Tax=Novispirillum sp. DQ9 TaxID=3398612 RepID=UPI003C7E614F